MNNLPLESDLETQIDADLAGSGRTGMVPPEATIGARRVRRGPSQAEGTSGGAAVAPTEKAELRERERHRLQELAGVVPASQQGNLRQRRASTASRAALDAAARRADHMVR
jgi:hypothetical protein